VQIVDVATDNAVIKLQFISLTISNPDPNLIPNLYPNPKLNRISNPSINPDVTSADPLSFYHRPIA